MQSFKSNRSQCLKKNMTEKIAGSRLAFEELKRVYSKYGKKGVIAILSNPKQHSLVQPPIQQKCQHQYRTQIPLPRRQALP